ncbi:MAG: hypothetical protein AAF997_02420 [Myxococcota bacterium]
MMVQGALGRRRHLLVTGAIALLWGAFGPSPLGAQPDQAAPEPIKQDQPEAPSQDDGKPEPGDTDQSSGLEIISEPPVDQPLPDRPRDDEGEEETKAEKDLDRVDTTPRPDRPRVDETDDDEYAVAGFDKGSLNPFFIQSKNGRFRLNLGIYTQFRYTGNIRETPDPDQDKYEGAFSIPRTRIFWEGLFTHGIGFHLRINISDTGNVSLIDAHLDLNFGELIKNQRTNGFWLLRIGRFFRAVSRENWMFPQDLLGVDSTGVEDVMGPGNGDGGQLYFALDRYRIWMAITADALGGSATFPADDTNVTFSTRSEYQVGKSDWSNWSDTIGRRGRAFGVLFGAAAAYRYSQTAVDFDDAQHSGTVTADISLSGNGFQTLTYGTVNWARVDGQLQYFWGFVTQGGYFINKMWQLYAEYDRVSPGNREGFTSYNALSIGSNVFPFEWTNRYRATIEGGMLFNAISSTLVPPLPVLGWLPAASGNQYRIRVQFVFGF